MINESSKAMCDSRLAAKDGLMNKYKYLLRNVGILTVSNFSSKILVFLMVPLYTSVLSTEEYGIYDISISTITLLFPILTVNIVDALMRFMLDEKYNKKSVVLVGVQHVLIGFLIGGLLLFVIDLFDLFPAINGLKVYILLYFVFYVLNQFLIQFSKGIEKVFDMAIAGIIGTVVMIISNVILLLVLKCGLEGFFIANTLAQLTPALYLLIRTRTWTYIAVRDHDLSVHKEMLFYCVPLIATVIGWWVNNASDKYVVSLICGLSANGLLAVSYKIPQIINTIQGIFIQAWQISAVKEYGTDEAKVFYGKAFVVLNLLMSFSCSLLIILTKPIGHVLYAKEFYAAWEYVPFLLISSVLNSASGFLGPILSAKKDSKSMAMSAVYGATTNIILNIVLVLAIDVQGSTIATVISSCIIYYVRKKAVFNDIHINNSYTVWLTWILLCAQAVLEIYTNFWWIEIIVIICMIIINRTALISLYRTGSRILLKKRRKKD